MATEVGNIHIGLYVDVGESRRFTDVANIVEKSSMRMNSALGHTSTAVRALRGQMSQNLQFRVAQNSLRDLTRATDATTQLRAAIVGLSSVATGSLTGAFSAAYLIQMADKARLLNNQIKTVTSSSTEFGAIQESLFQVSQRTRSSFEATTTLYARMARATDHFGLSQERLLRTTETIQKAFAIGGASPQEAQGAAIQLSQGIASDRLGGEEFRSVAENAPVLLKGIAAALGVNIGKLREMAHAGELTAQVVTEAILKSSEDIDKAFGKMVPTVAQSWTMLNNAILRYTGESDEAYGITKNIASAIAGLAENLEDVMYWVTRVTAGLGLLYAARKVTLSAQGFVGGVRANNAAAADFASGLTDQGQAISKRLVDLDKERATVTQKVASANAAVVSSLQRQVDEGKKLVRDNALRILQTRDGSKAQLQAIERYERSVASLQSRVQKLASTPLVSNESADVQRRLADIDSERAVLIEKQVQNTAKLEAAQKRMSALRRGGANILGAFGGVSGLAVTLGIMGVVAAVGSYAASLQRSAEATQNMKDELNALGLLSDEAAGKIDKTTKSLKELSADELRDKLRGVNEEIQKLSSQDSTVKNVWDSLFGEGELSIGEIQRQLESVINNPSRAVGGVNRNAASQIKELIDQAKAGSVTLEEAQSRLDKIAAVKLSPEMDKLIGATRSALPYFDALIERQKQLNEEISAPTKRPEERYWNTRTLAAQNQQKIQAAQDSVVTTLVDEANLNESEKRIKAIMDQIVKDMEKAGQTINSAAVRADAERVYATEQRTSDIGNATELIKGFESFRSTPYWDVNAYRVGYGSDTVTLSDGSIQKVTQGISVTMADANRDLERRIGEFQDTIRSQIGAGTFESMDKSQQAALTSIAYNYGDLPDRIVEAIRSGDQRTVYNAIKGLGSDNGGVNRGRRNQEAELYLSGTSKITQSTVGFDKTLESQQRMLDALLAETGIRQQLNPLVNDYGKALSTLEAAQQLLNAAQEQGTAAGNELKNVQQLLKGDFSSLTPEARAQAEAMLALAQKTGEATASGNRMEESQERLRNRLQQSSELGKSVFGGIIDDIRSGASAGEILNNVFDKLLDKMIEMSLTSIFDGTSGVAGGGPLGGLFSGLFSLFGFDDGGYTGPGGKKKPAGVVHAGEFVFDAEATRKAGVENLYRMMDMLKGNSLLSMPGYDMGGFVGRVSMPSFDVGGYANDNSTLSTMAGGLQRVQPMKVIIESNDEKFRVFVRDEATGVVEEASPQIIKTSVQASSQNVMPTVAKYNSEKAGAEWR